MDRFPALPTASWRTNLKPPLLLQLFHKPVIYQIFRLEAANLFVDRGQKPDGIPYPIYIRVDPPLVQRDRSFIPFCRILDARQTKPLGQTPHDRRLVVRLQNESNGLNQGAENSLGDVGRSIDEAPSGYDASSLVRNAELANISQDTKSLALQN